MEFNSKKLKMHILVIHMTIKLSKKYKYHLIIKKIWYIIYSNSTNITKISSKVRGIKNGRN